MYNSFPVTFKNISVRIIVSAIFIWGLILPFFAKTASSASNDFGVSKTKTLFSGIYLDEDTMLTALQTEARNYRQQGVEYQRIGDLDTALAYYQKAIELDPAYTVAYNDLGIIYEAKDMPDRAEENYLKAIKMNPNYLSSYSNLALLYEGRRDLQKAADYWKMRIELGPVGDPWTEKAKIRLNDIRLVLEDEPVNPGEDNVLGLMNDVLIQKTSRKAEDKTFAKKHLDKAKTSAGSLDPAYRGVDELLDKVQMRMLSR